MDRMSALDAEFLYAEDGLNHMHIGACAVFEGPAPPAEQLEELVARALPATPRYRQRVQSVPLGLGRPVWVDDAGFDLHDHVFHRELPRPGSDAQLQARVSVIMGSELDRRHPLWEMWVIGGLSGGRWAIVAKVHHCMVDGIAGTGLLEVLLDAGPTPATRPPAEPWAPTSPPGSPRLVADAAGDLGRAVIGAAGAAAASLAHPRQAAQTVREMASGAGSWARLLRPTPLTSIEGPVGGARVWTWATASLQDAKHIRAAAGGTVNDVILTAVTRGFREVLLARGEDPQHVEIRTLVPVSVRTRAGALDNEVSAMVAELPVAVGDDRDRYRAVREEMARLKATAEVDAGDAATTIAGLIAAPLLSWGTRGAVAVLRHTGQRTITTVTTNVPGPQQPLYAEGRRLLAYYPYVPVALGVRLAVAIVSYNGGLFFGITGDRHTEGDLAVLADGIEAGIAELLSHTHERTAP